MSSLVVNVGVDSNPGKILKYFHHKNFFISLLPTAGQCRRKKRKLSQFK